MTNIKHTPTPWERSQTYGGHELITGTDSEINPETVLWLTDGRSPIGEQLEADAEFIVHAYNMHDELVNILEELISVWHLPISPKLKTKVFDVFAKAKGAK